MAEFGATYGALVQLRIPAEPRLSRVARLAASGLASLEGCTIDEIEDIKLAVSEVLIALVEHGDGHDIEIDLEARPTSFIIRGRCKVDGFNVHHPDLDLARTVLAGVAEAHDIELADGVAQIWAMVARSGTT